MILIASDSMYSQCVSGAKETNAWQSLISEKCTDYIATVKASQSRQKKSEGMQDSVFSELGNKLTNCQNWSGNMQLYMHSYRIVLHSPATLINLFPRR